MYKKYAYSLCPSINPVFLLIRMIKKRTPNGSSIFNQPAMLQADKKGTIGCFQKQLSKRTVIYLPKMFTPTAFEQWSADWQTQLLPKHNF